MTITEVLRSFNEGGQGATQKTVSAVINLLK